jgi:hypothetical protein
VRTGRLAGDLIFGVVDILAEWQKRKKLVTAGDAAKSRNAEDSPQRCAEGIGVFGGDTLQLQITANSTMGAEHMTEGRSTGTKALSAPRTPPGNHPRNAGEIVQKGSPARPAAIRGITSRTNHQSWASTGDSKLKRC